MQYWIKMMIQSLLKFSHKLISSFSSLILNFSNIFYYKKNSQQNLNCRLTPCKEYKKIYSLFINYFFLVLVAWNFSQIPSLVKILFTVLVGCAPFDKNLRISSSFTSTCFPSSKSGLYVPKYAIAFPSLLLLLEWNIIRSSGFLVWVGRSSQSRVRWSCMGFWVRGD